MTDQSSSIRITPVGGALGACVSGVSLSAITGDEFEHIKDAFLKYCVLIFPDQHLSIEAHKAFALRWGEPSISPFVRYMKDHPFVLPLSNLGKSRSVTENWHYDSSFLEAPPSITILSARQIPVGGDTMWSNQYRAYESLSSGMKEMLDGVRAEFSGVRLAEFGGSKDPAPSTLHPVCRTHPETGRRALFVGRPGDTLPRLENMHEAESLPIIRYLYEHSVDPANIYRHHWETGEVVMWDNRCTMHYAVHDYGDEPRDLHRISIQGTVPY